MHIGASTEIRLRACTEIGLTRGSESTRHDHTEMRGGDLRRDQRAAVIVDEEIAPYAFVHIRGPVTLSVDLEGLLRFATAIAGRYMGARRAKGQVQRSIRARARVSAPIHRSSRRHRA